MVQGTSTPTIPMAVTMLNQECGSQHPEPEKAITSRDKAIDFERYRAYLTVLASAQIRPAFQAHVAPSDIVNITLAEADRKQHQFRGATTGELQAWLRKGLANNLRDEIRKLNAGKRAVDRQVSFDVEGSNLRLEKTLVAPGPSPSEVAIRNEETLRLADAILQLPEAQRRVIELYSLRGLPLKEVAAEIGRTEAAVGGLFHRAMKQLSREMKR